MLRRHLAIRRHIMALALDASQYAVALAAAKDESELLGLYDFDLVQQVEELRRQIAEIKANGIGSTPKAGDTVGGGSGGAESPLESRAGPDPRGPGADPGSVDAAGPVAS